MIGNTTNNSLLFTFDYELFLGKNSGTVIDVLVKPTQKLLKLFSGSNIKAIFFVDTIYLIRLQALGLTNEIAKKDFDIISNQLKEISVNGHYIYIHLHPHWLDATFNDKKKIWDLSNHSKYRVASLDKEERLYYFRTSTQLLSQITGRALFEFDGYRAGGWSITPFDDFIECFRDCGIRYEFSMMPGRYLESDAAVYDFRNAPQKIVYKFNEDICKEEIDGEFTAVTITSYAMNELMNYLDKLFQKIKWYINKVNPFIQKKGSTVKAIVFSKGDALSKKEKNRRIAQFERLNIFQFISMRKHYHQSGMLHSVSHPKLMTSFDFLYLKIFLRSETNIDNCNTNFKHLES
jgi:hypothetical protein